MTQTIDHKADQCLNDIQKYEKWGNLLAGQSCGITGTGT